MGCREQVGDGKQEVGDDLSSDWGSVKVVATELARMCVCVLVNLCRPKMLISSAQLLFHFLYLFQLVTTLCYLVNFR